MRDLAEDERRHARPLFLDKRRKSGPRARSGSGQLQPSRLITVGGSVSSDSFHARGGRMTEALGRKRKLNSAEVL